MTDADTNPTYRRERPPISELSPVIEQASGIVMAWMGCDSETALSALFGVSNRLNRTVLMVAEEVIDVVQTSEPAALIAWLRAQLGPARERCTVLPPERTGTPSSS